MKYSLSHNNNWNSLQIWGIPVLFLFLFNSEYMLSKKLYSDSVVKNFPEISVEAERVFSSKLAEFSPNSAINREQLELLGSVQINESLIYVPGIFIKNYGGMGGLKTVSIRGSSANQTSLLLNGIKLNSNQNGMSDLSIIPSSMISQVEVIRTGLSSVFGGNAAAGAINISTRNHSTNKFVLNYSYGSFSENLLALQSNLQIGDLKISTAAEYNHSNGDYPFEITHFGTNQIVTRQNSDFDNLSAAVNFDYKLNDIKLNAFTLLYNSKRGVPGAVLQGHIESADARMTESGYLFALSANADMINNWQFVGGVNSRYNFLNYKDKNLIGYHGLPLDNDFNSQDISFSANISKIETNSLIQFGIEGFLSHLNGEMLQSEVKGRAYREGIALSFIANQDYKLIDRFDFLSIASFRIDFFNDNSPAYSPYLGVILKDDISGLSIKSNFSGNFRMPSFNELYYLNYGTSGLNPEKSLSYNIGITYNYKIFQIELSAFVTQTKDLILSVPRSPAVWSAQNIGKSEIKGLEIIASAKSDEIPININFNYTYQYAKDLTEGTPNFGKFLIYVPQEIANVNVSYNFLWGIVIAANFNYSSYRFSLQSNDIKSVLPEYFTLNLKIIKKIMSNFGNFRLYFASDNIFDYDYSIIRNFPMPGRILRAGIIYDI